MKQQKFNPTNINDFENLESVEDWTLEVQKRVVNEDPFMNQLLRHNEKHMNMKEKWSNILINYLVIFTILMFITLWFNGRCVVGTEKFCISDLNPITLNFLITAGFVKVIGVVWIIVRHLFPPTK